MASGCKYFITGDQTLINAIKSAGIALIPIDLLSPNEIFGFIQDSGS
jgi:hypothetical protein